MKRSCGTLMHISSLPSPYGLGTLGKAAFAFADFLVASGQSYWQMLPLGPTGYGDSPYQCASTFAGNPYFIDLDLLIEDGLLLPEEVETVDWGDDEAHVDFGRIFCARHEVLRRAFARGFERDAAAVAAFREAQAGWVEGYALFSAVKEHFGLRPFNEWDDDIRLHTDAAVARYRQLLHDEIDYHVYIQYLFYRQWNALRAYLSENQIRVIGDLPIYVPYDSADVWEHPSLFQLDDDRRPLGVAGVPPDYFSADGQLWGNPLYDWDAMADEGYRWWIERLRAAGRLFDVVRLDHFRGLESYWDVPYGETTARIGTWRPGPGMALVNAIREALPGLSIIAEDLGFLTPEVRRLLSDSGFPGMRIMQFGFESRDGASRDLPHNYPIHSVAYVGTHDNMTAMQWIAEAAPEQVGYAVDYLNLTEREGLANGMIRGLFASPAALTIVQMQDFLALGAQARMNHPSTLGGNWQWRMTEREFASVDRARIRYFAAMFARER